MLTSSSNLAVVRHSATSVGSAASWIFAVQAFNRAAVCGAPSLARSLAAVRREVCGPPQQRQDKPLVALDAETARFVVRAAIVAAMEFPDARQDATHLYLGLKDKLGVGALGHGEGGGGSIQQQQQLDPFCDVLCPKTVAVAMNELIKCGQWRGACELFGLLPPKQETISAAIEAFAKGHDWMKALMLLRRLDTSRWNERHASVVIACLRVPARRHTHHWASALTVYSKSVEIGFVSCSVVALNNILSVLGSSRRWIDAMSVLRHSGSTGLLDRGNAVTVTQTCFALHHRGWSEALYYASRIISCNESNLSRVVDAIALKKLTDLCIHSRRWEEATVVLHLSQTSSRCQLDEDTYVQLAVVFHSHWPSEATIDCLNKVYRLDLLHRALNSVIANCDDCHEAEKFAQWLERAGGVISTSGIATLTELHAKKHKWIQALSWFAKWACDPARRAEKRVTPYYHDCLQLGMQSAHRSSSFRNSRADWLTSIGLFKFVCGDLGVDVSPISRSLVQSLCYESGADEQAAELMMFAVMTTERRRQRPVAQS